MSRRVTDIRRELYSESNDIGHYTYDSVEEYKRHEECDRLKERIADQVACEQDENLAGGLNTLYEKLSQISYCYPMTDEAARTGMEEVGNEWFGYQLRKVGMSAAKHKVRSGLDETELLCLDPTVETGYSAQTV